MAGPGPVSPISFHPFAPPLPSPGLPAGRAFSSPRPMPAPTPTPTLAGRFGNGSALGAGPESESAMAILDSLANDALMGMDFAASMMPLQRAGGGLDINRLSRLAQLDLYGGYLGKVEKGFGLADAAMSDNPISEATKWGLGGWLGDLASSAAEDGLKAGQSMLEAGTRLSRFQVFAGAALAESAVGSAVESVIDGIANTPADLVKPTDSMNDALTRSNRLRMEKFESEWSKASWIEKPFVPFSNMFEGIGMDIKAAGSWVANAVSSWF